jgi:hypothetical protein
MAVLCCAPSTGREGQRVRARTRNKDEKVPFSAIPAPAPPLPSPPPASYPPSPFFLSFSYLLTVADVECDSMGDRTTVRGVDDGTRDVDGVRACAAG